DGVVYLADVNGQDSTGPMVAEMRTSFQSFGRDATVKAFRMVQALLNRDGPVSPSIGVDTDYKDRAILSPIPESASNDALWDEAEWDEFLWSEPVLPQLDWITTDGLGQNVSIKMRVDIPQAGEGQYSTQVTFQVNGFSVLMEKGGWP